MTDAELAKVPRAAENCPFYPACYIAGDCDHEDWKNGSCGLPPDIKAQHYTDLRQERELRHARWALADQLRREALRGDHDHLLKSQEAPATAQQAAGE